MSTKGGIEFVTKPEGPLEGELRRPASSAALGGGWKLSGASGSADKPGRTKADGTTTNPTESRFLLRGKIVWASHKF